MNDELKGQLTEALKIKFKNDELINQINELNKQLEENDAQLDKVGDACIKIMNENSVTTTGITHDGKRYLVELTPEQDRIKFIHIKGLVL